MDPALESEVQIAHLIYVRNRRAHRTQLWWKYFSMIHRRLCQSVTRGSLFPGEAHFLVKKLIPQAARSIHSMLAHGTFVSLGFAVLAVLSRIYSLLLPSVPKRQQPRETKLDTEMPDMGNEIAEDEIRLENAVVTKRKTKKKNKKSRPNAIDAIFG